MDKYRKDSNSFTRLKALEFFVNFIKNHDDAIENDDVFTIIDEIVSQEELAELIKSTYSTKELTMIQEKCSLGYQWDFNSDPKRILWGMWRHGPARSTLRQAIAKLANTFINNNAKHNPQDGFKKRFKELQSTLGLSDFEIDILLVMLCVRDDTLSITSPFRRRFDERDKIVFIAKCLDYSTIRVVKAVSPQEKLRRYSCLDKDLDFVDDLDPFLYGIENEPLSNIYYQKYQGEVLPWDFYGDLAIKHGEILKDMISAGGGKSPVNILLYGAPGTGKTSFARTLATELKLNCFAIAQNANDRHDRSSCSTPEFRFGALQVCDEQVEPSQSMLIVDEADEMLRGNCSGGGFFMLFGATNRDSVGDKGLLNSVLDSIRTPTIWITNTKANELDESSRRRFDYSIRFDALSSIQRLAIWKNNVTKMKLEKLFSNALMTEFAEKYATSAGGITLVLQNIVKLKPAKKEVATLVEKLMLPHCELLDIPNQTDKFLPAKDYSLDGLNIKGGIKLPQIVEAIRYFQKDKGSSPDRPRMNLLLSGAPGTGKTELVKYLGTTLKTKVVVKMGSDLLSKWVGGTEQNIKAAFAQAEEEKAILFLDEIDGLLQSRQSAKNSWEVTRVNELLHQMENFNGVLIGATNFSTNLDAATLRRFTFKLEFDYLDIEGKKLFFERMFQTQLSEPEEKWLAAIPSLAPGDFRTVRQSLYYLSKKTNNDDRLSGLERESTAKGQNRFSAKLKVGF
ncbi:MAG: AAA family ATPase [Victivallaceae bacterium]|nr:AAA family ATPase [Victivallaceae bacterium]